jgi:tetratricopeptide (TPR) repeat protein
LALKPDSWETRYNFALALNKADHPNEAIVELKKVTRLKDSYANAWLEMGVIYQNRFVTSTTPTTPTRNSSLWRPIIQRLHHQNLAHPERLQSKNPSHKLWWLTRRHSRLKFPAPASVFTFRKDSTRFPCEILFHLYPYRFSVSFFTSEFLR